MRLGMRSALPSPRRTGGSSAGQPPVHQAHQRPPGRARRRGGARQGLHTPSHARRSGQRRGAGLSSGCSCTGPAAARRRPHAQRAAGAGRAPAAARRPGRAAPAARVVEAAHAPAVDGQQLVAGATPARFGGAAAQHALHVHAAERAFADAQAERGGQRGGFALPGTPARASSGAAAGRRCRAPRRAARRPARGPPPAAARRAMSASSIGPPPRRRHSARITSSSVRAAGAQAQVQRQRDQRALGVVADGGVGRVLVAAVVLGPGVEAGLRHALHAGAPAWPARR